MPITKGEPVAEVVQSDTFVLPETDSSIIDKQATSLRRAATVLLILSLCLIKFVQGWLGMFAAMSVLCASSCTVRTQRVKISASIASGFAIIAAIVSVVAVVAGTPQVLSHEILAECIKMPVATFEWGSTIAAAHDLQMHAPDFSSNNHFRDDVVSSYPWAEREKVVVDHAQVEAAETQLGVQSDSSTSLATPSKWGGVRGVVHAALLKPIQPPEPVAASTVTIFSVRRILKQVANMISPEQEAVCKQVARFVADYGSAFLLLSAVLEWGFFMSAVVVAKRACLLQQSYLHSSSMPESVTAVPLAAEAA